MMRSSREGQVPQRRRTPSFSSSLLDAIYRSIDESNGGSVDCRETTTATMVRKQSNSVSSARRDSMLGGDKEISNLGRAIMVENWVEKQSVRSSTHCNSTSSSSDSSFCGGIFSSSETESSSFKGNSRRLSSSFAPKTTNNKPLSVSDKQNKPECEGGFTKTKLKALKIYSELKKAKQPISPGGRIATFLNSIFSLGSGNRKVKMCSIGATQDVSFERKSKSACSSVASFSMSCLNRTPPSRGKSNHSSAKRSVRFYPVSVIVDEDSRPCGHKSIYEDDPGLMPMPQKTAKSCFPLKVQEPTNAADDYLRNYHDNKSVRELELRGFPSYAGDGDDDDDDDEDDDDDDESCSSSDLFELDHLVGIGRYREELPVYETTNLKTNQAIAHGFIL